MNNHDIDNDYDNDEDYAYDPAMDDMTDDEAVTMLIEEGYSEDEAKRMIGLYDDEDYREHDDDIPDHDDYRYMVDEEDFD